MAKIPFLEQGNIWYIAAERLGYNQKELKESFGCVVLGIRLKV